MKAEQIQKRLGENLRKLRRNRELTQAELAEKAQVSEDTIKSIELARSWPSGNTLARISEALGIDVHQLFLPTARTSSGNEDIEKEIEDFIAKKFSEYLHSVAEKIYSE
ncbi:MAG: helix-turn-helix domain-containing protein [Treponemataceae bacterium]|nr:helix-turn-helix domain-containing protein [Treponemataceae bacterium]